MNKNMRPFGCIIFFFFYAKLYQKFYNNIKITQKNAFFYNSLTMNCCKHNMECLNDHNFTNWIQQALNNI